MLRRVNDLIKNKVHTNIISVYKLTAKEACMFLEKHMSPSVKDSKKEALINVAETSMSSKLIGPEKDLFSYMIVESV